MTTYLSDLSNPFCYNNILSLLAGTLFIIVLLLDNEGLEKLKFKRNYKMITLFSIIANIIFVTIPLYLAFTPVGNTVINGIQGRYFTPIILVSAILLFKA